MILNVALGMFWVHFRKSDDLLCDSNVNTREAIVFAKRGTRELEYLDSGIVSLCIWE